MLAAPPPPPLPPPLPPLPPAGSEAAAFNKLLVGCWVVGLVNSIKWSRGVVVRFGIHDEYADMACVLMMERTHPQYEQVLMMGREKVNDPCRFRLSVPPEALLDEVDL